MTRSLTGKVALVTGGAKGIGAGIAKAMAAAGASVVVNFASDRPGAERVVADIKAAGGHAFAIQADVSVVAEVEHLCAEAVAKSVRPEAQAQSPQQANGNNGISRQREMGFAWRIFSLSSSPQFSTTRISEGVPTARICSGIRNRPPSIDKLTRVSPAGAFTTTVAVPDGLTAIFSSSGTRSARSRTSGCAT